MINFTKVAKEIEQENKEFEYNATKLEISNDIWNSRLSPLERLEIMNSVNLSEMTTLEKLRACVKHISTMI